MKKVFDIRRQIEKIPAKTDWDKGVRDYAIDMLDSFVENNPCSYIAKLCEEDLLDGAKNWSDHSWHGHTHAITYDRDIQKTLAPRDPSEGSYNCEGKLWLDLQAEALEQAATILLRIANRGPKINFADSEIKDCISQLRDLIRDRESFVIGDNEHDEIFNKDIHYLKMAVQILEAVK